MTAIALVVGLVGGVGISRLLAAVLVDLSPLDPVAFGEGQRISKVYENRFLDLLRNQP